MRWNPAVILLLWFCFTGNPVRATSELPNYFTRLWQTKDGLPENNVTSVVQTRDGYLWLGTRSGLVRFDGVRFTVFDGSNTPEMQSPHVTTLFEAGDGTLWIGHDTGEVTCYKEGNFRVVPIQAAWRGGKIFSIAEDKTGDIWLLNQDGDLARVKDGFVIASPPGTVAHLLSIARNPKGGFWIQRDSEVLFLENSRLKPIEFDVPVANRYVQGIGPSRDGGLWVMTESRILKWRDGKWIEDLGPAPWEWSPVHTVIEMKDGHLAAATVNHGLYLFFPQKGSLQFCRTNGFSSDWVTSLCEDREGDLWAGTGNGGLAVLRTVNVSTLSPPDQWQGRAVLSVAAGGDGALWIGTEGAGLYRFHDGSWTNFDEPAGLWHRYIWSVAFDAQDHVWVGTWGSGVFEQKGWQFEHPAELQDIFVAALLPARDGSLFVGTSTGLLRYEAGKATWLGRKPELFSPDVRAVKEDGNGAVWFGMSGGGLACLKEGKLQQFRRTNGLSSDFVQCLYPEADGTLWIGTFGGGLNRLKAGRFVAITKNHGLPNDVICEIQDDGSGFFWISSHGGITRVSKAELNRCADGLTGKLHCLTYGLSDGLPTMECSGGFQPAGCQTADGHLWFPTAKGLVSIDPTNVRINQLPPPVVIEEIRVDGHAITDTGAAENPLRIAPGRHRLEFDYTGLSFAAPERVRFKYRLDGWEKDWVEAGTKRLANYSYIPPGDYIFRVTACNNDGVWSETGAKMAFTVLPFFWQTMWFRILAGAMVIAASGGIVWLDARQRMRRRLERLERQRAVERERARIARDIHDDLGASLTRITMLSQAAQGEPGDPAEAAANLHRIYGTARELTRAMDEIVWAVNPKHDTLDSLASYLGRFAQDFLAAAHVRCRLDMPVQLPAWPMTAEVRHNLFLAFKEALNNVVKHAGALEVRISLTLSAVGFVLDVSDDGRGFTLEQPGGPLPDPERLLHGNGLANMRRRLAEVGGRFEIESAPGRGTQVRFVVPVMMPAN